MEFYQIGSKKDGNMQVHIWILKEIQVPLNCFFYHSIILKLTWLDPQD